MPRVAIGLQKGFEQTFESCSFVLIANHAFGDVGLWPLTSRPLAPLSFVWVVKALTCKSRLLMQAGHRQP